MTSQGDLDIKPQLCAKKKKTFSAVDRLSMRHRFVLKSVFRSKNITDP